MVSAIDGGVVTLPQIPCFDVLLSLYVAPIKLLCMQVLVESDSLQTRCTYTAVNEFQVLVITV